MAQVIRLKAGVKLHNPANPQQTVSSVWGIVLPIIAARFEQYGSPCTITSAFDGTHSRVSLHYGGRALDFRLWHVPLEDHADLITQLKEDLGRDFDVVLENDHIHIEFQPKV
jgi:hypothetical protein